ncbi:hypothetical protein [Prosthecobacter dejongeii]|uniref:Uncharacterized protein n=1 Tax=Prosthecobacter dejongeii TaxID=48465 RepID=A0A7W7YLX9_9BACT|nr:hypothetical protein [Prosthecobacter dejongeii]MBB5038412.1 hypothetical protein [Prosthecobacter dejongeii]
MARRAQSGLKPIHLVGLLLLLGALIGLGYVMLNRTTDPMTGITALSTEEYLESSTALSGNTYRIEGTVDDRLDNWRAMDGRLFSVQVSEAGSFLPVWVPANLETNIQRGQRYVFKVRVLETGILEVLELLKA